MHCLDPEGEHKQHAEFAKRNDQCSEAAEGESADLEQTSVHQRNLVLAIAVRFPKPERNKQHDAEGNRNGRNGKTRRIKRDRTD